MQNGMEKSEKTALYISNDRGLCTAKLIRKDGFSLYKEALKEKQGFFESGFLASASFTAAPDGYCCAVKGGYSVKDYLGSGEEPDLPALGRLAEALEALLHRCAEWNISPYDILYDYRAVFTDAGFLDFKFIYMPGAAASQSAASCGELIRILFLNLYDVLPEKEYQSLGDLVESLAGAKEPEEILRLLREIQQYRAQYGKNRRENAAEKLRGWIRRYAQNETHAGNAKRDGARDAERKDPPGKETLPAADGVLILQGERKLRDFYLEKTVSGGKGATVKIGRDRDWADICVEDMMVSRHHAEICAEAGDGIRIRDMSLNGTVADDVPFRNREIVKKADTDIKIYITEDCAVRVRYRTGA